MTITGVETAFQRLRVGFFDLTPGGDLIRYTLLSAAEELENLQSLLAISVWVSLPPSIHPQNRSESWFGDLFYDYRGAVDTALRIPLISISYNSPLWVTLLTGGASVTATTTSVSYTLVRLYNKVLDLRKKQSDVAMHRLINQMLMDELQFTAAQRQRLRTAEEYPKSLPPNEETNRITSILEAINRSSSALDRINTLEVTDE